MVSACLGGLVKATILVALGQLVWFVVGFVIQTAVTLPIGWLTAP